LAKLQLGNAGSNEHALFYQEFHSDFLPAESPVSDTDINTARRMKLWQVKGRVFF